MSVPTDGAEAALMDQSPILLLGALAGALTMTAAMVAVPGYTPAYPVSQILLTV
jgi:hypothetical protein